MVKNSLSKNLKACKGADSAAVESHSEISTIIYSKYGIICVYRPPSGNVDIFLKSLSRALLSISKCVQFLILCGDLNINFYHKTINKKKMCDLFSSFDLSVTTYEPTRIFTNIHSQTSCSILDYVATNINERLYDCVVFNPHLSDHLAHKFTFEVNAIDMPEYAYERISRNFSPNNLETFKSMVSLEFWSDINKYDNCDEAWTNFIERLIYCLNCTCPYKKCILKTNKPKGNWFDNELMVMKGKLDDLYWLQSNYVNDKLSNEYKTLQKKYKNLIKTKKGLYYQNKINNSDNKTKMIWSIVNSKLNRKKDRNIDINLNRSSTILTDAADIANEFATHFSEISKKMLSDRYGVTKTLCSSPPYLINSFVVSYVTENEVLRTIEGLKNKNTSGFDDINLKIVILIKHIIIQPLTNLINCSLHTAIFPQILKMANVAPVYKKNERENIENYRQISVLSVFSKILEKIVHEQILNFATRFNLINPNQHGFLPNKSIETACFHFLNFVYSHIDQGKYVFTLFFDLSIAFDTINRSFLLSKLYNMGFRGNILNWIDSYLSNRKMIVKYKNICSNTKSVNLGVPQGSVLGPLLFLLYVNDLSQNIKNGHTTMYADDTTVVVAADSVDMLREKIINVRHDMEEWCKSNGLILNINKTVYMNIYNRKPVPYTFANSLNILISDRHKFLGTMIDPTLTYECHVDYVCAKLNSAYFAILNLKNTLDEVGLMSVYYSLAYSHISCNVISWGCSSMCDRVLASQKRILRLIFNLKPMESCRTTFMTKKILTFFGIYIYKCAAFVIKNKPLFKILGSTGHYNVRNNNTLLVPKHKTSMYKDSPTYNCIKIYNKLPKELKSLHNQKCLNKLKTFLCRKAFYSLDEFMRCSENIW